jgi:hypothetical protein
MSKKVVLTLDDGFYKEFKEAYGRPGKPMTQIIIDKMYEILKNDEDAYFHSPEFYDHIDQCLKEVKEGKCIKLGEVKSMAEVAEKLGWNR